MNSSDLKTNVIKSEEQDQDWNTSDEDVISYPKLPKTHPDDITNANIKTRLQCIQCSKSYTMEATLKKHMIDFHIDDKDKPYQCEICLSKDLCKKFRSENSFKAHKQNIHGPLHLKCKYCSKKLSCEANLKAHYNNIHSKVKVKSFECKFCSANFTSKVHLNVHVVAKHENEAGECENIKSHKCEICSKAFYKPKDLVKHVLTIHVVDKPFECQYCSKTFMTENELAKHVKLHENKIRVSCDVCFKRFQEKQSLVRHFKKKHRRFFHCRKCLQSFEIQSELDYHVKITLGIMEKTYCGPNLKCEVCDESFISECSLKIHTNGHLQDQEIKTEVKQSVESNTEVQTRDKLQCDLCSKTFDLASYLVLHRKNAHGNLEWSCKVCLKMFKKRCFLTAHEKIVHATVRSFKCDVCECIFKCRSTLNQHKLTHLDEKRLKCQICFKSFNYASSLKIHMANYHRGERPFKCHMCPQTWALSSQLKVHLISHTTERSFKCDLCSKSFKHSTHLNEHKRKVHLNPEKFKVRPSKPRKHSDVTIYLCTMCSFKTKEEKDVAIHYSQHDLPRVSLFPLGDKYKFNPLRDISSKSYHVIQKRYKCKHCSNHYVFTGSLKEHLLTHTNENPNTCHHCSIQFSSFYNLKRHLMTFPSHDPKKLQFSKKARYTAKT